MKQQITDYSGGL